jgi:hypothetical protein
MKKILISIIAILLVSSCDRVQPKLSDVTCENVETFYNQCDNDADFLNSYEDVQYCRARYLVIISKCFGGKVSTATF